MKSEIAMGDCTKKDIERHKKNNTQKELVTVDKERSETKVRGRKKDETEIMVNSPLTIGMPRKEQQNAV